MSQFSIKEVAAEMARRKIQFHNKENWNDIKLWGLFNWGEISTLLKKGLLITDMRKENKIVWVTPSKEFWDKEIKPLTKKTLDELTKLAGWK